jgi:hypothetical protein
MNDSLTQVPQWYDLRQIESMTQIPYATLRPFAELPSLRAALGAKKLPGENGVRWPASSLPTWQNLAEGIRDGTIKRSTVNAFLEKQGLTQSDIVPMSQGNIVSIPPPLIEAIALAVKSALPPPQDALWTLKQAREECGLPPLLLASLRFKIGRKWYVRRSDCYRLIESLR